MSADEASTATRDSGAIRVLVVDDQAIVRDGLVAVLDLLADVEVVGEAADGEQAVAAAASAAPDVVLMDLRMPGVGGAEATRRILDADPRVAIVVLTTYADDESIAGALAAGARGYLTKDAGRAELAAAVRSAAAGQATFAREVGERIIRGLTTPEPSIAARFPQLTTREAEVLDLMAQGLSNPEIAARLVLGVSTVKSHVNTIFAKVGARDRGHAIALATGRARPEE